MKVHTGRTTWRVLVGAGLAAVLFLFLAQYRMATMPGSAGSPDDDAIVALTGETMGTTYRILLPAAAVGDEAPKQALSEAVAVRLFHLDRELLSTYTPASELSRFNAMPVGQSMILSPELVTVIEAATAVHEQSGGAFDITVKPLVDLWGFGSAPRGDDLPSQQAIARALAQVGMDKFSLDRQQGRATKQAPVTLDLSAVAKGFAVDELARLLEAREITDYVVEIGGEIVSRGTRPGATPWRLGIETPASGRSTLYRSIRHGQGKLALAGSGNYRNFFMVDGKRYSHSIDPRRGYPVTHDLASVTVVADSAMQADAWATALLVMGPEAGMKRANELQLAAYFISTGAGGFQASHSRAFEPYLQDNP